MIRLLYNLESIVKRLVEDRLQCVSADEVEAKKKEMLHSVSGMLRLILDSTKFMSVIVISSLS